MKKVLIIEDDTTVRENTAELLELAKYEVILAANGKLGVAEAKKHQPDIIVCDIMMPELVGYGVLKILSAEKSTKQIPFIFLSAKTEHQDIRKGMNMGADDYLTKPFDESELITAIESRLAKVAILNETRNNNQVKADTGNDDEEIKTIDQLKNYFTDEGEEYSYKAGETLYHEGDNSNYIYLIYNGVVKASKIDEQGKELITGLYRDDDLFGFTSFTQNITYQETVIAIENTVVFKVLKSKLKELLLKNHNITLNLIDYFSDNVSEVKEQLLQMAYSSVRKKTANTILQFTEKIQPGHSAGIKISRSDLANVAGVATETFIRTLSDLKKDGLIDIEGRNIRVLDIEKLKKIV
ncbi:MAG: response regulator [Flavobacteriaceae bacterium]|nr:response regulator [Flavobacteriaceae bacterium]